VASLTGLNIKDQVEFINSELKKNKSMSLKKICKNLGLNKVKLNEKFNKAGYIYDANIRCYTQRYKEVEIIKPVVREHMININEFKSTLEEVKELLKLKDSLKEVVQYYNKSKNVIDIMEVSELKIDSNRFTKDLSNRLVKVYTNINENWMKFCKKYKQYKIQDLYSQALLEFMDKYK